MPSKRSPTTVKYLDRVLMLYICCAVSVLKHTKHFGSSVSARQNGKTYGRAAQNPFGNPVNLSNNPKVKIFTFWSFQVCRFLTDMGQSLKGWVPAPRTWKTWGRVKKNVPKDRNLFQKEEHGMHKKRKKETRKEIEEGKRKKEEEEGECRVWTNFSDMQNLMHSSCNRAILAR